MNRPFSVSTLAERWGCSRRHITNMVKKGLLKGFRAGVYMWRKNDLRWYGDILFGLKEPETPLHIEI